LPNRRDFLKVGGAFGLGAVTAGGIEYYLSQNEISDLKRQLKEPASTLEPNVNLYNWYDYIEPNLVTDFQSENGVTLNLSVYGNPDEMFAKVKAGGSGLDVVVASDYKVGELIPLQILKKIDFQKIPNFKHISEEFINPPYDSKQEYSVPYLWGTTGIGYNSDVVTDNFEGFEILFDEDKISKYSKKVVIVDEMREVFAAALKYLGYSLNDTYELY
jgi:spermidine/putrescine transport system substrate-binding protein